MVWHGAPGREKAGMFVQGRKKKDQKQKTNAERFSQANKKAEADGVYFRNLNELYINGTKNGRAGRTSYLLL